LGYVAPLKPNLRNAKVNNDLNWLLNADRPMSDVEISIRAESVFSQGAQSTVCTRVDIASPLGTAEAPQSGHVRVAARVTSATGSVVHDFSRTLEYTVAATSDSAGKPIARASLHLSLYLKSGNYLFKIGALLDTGVVGSTTLPI